METLLDYLLRMPPDECSHDRGHKHPFTVSELFAQEVGQINDLFFTAPPQVGKKTPTNVIKNEQEGIDNHTPEKFDALKVASASSSEKSDEDEDSNSSSTEDKPSENHHANEDTEEEKKIDPHPRSL